MGGDAGARDVAEGAGRVGLVARGVVYLVVAAIAVRIALGSAPDDQADQRGALQEIAEHAWGTVLLVVLAVGFGCYATWRAIRAVVGEDGDDIPWHKRAADLGRALLHVSLLLSTVSVLRGDRGDRGGSGNREQEWTARLMAEGWGRWLVAGVGALVVGTGVWLVHRGLSEGFRKHLERLHEWVVRLGRVGHVGKGLAFVLIGGFVLRAAWRFDAAEPIGLDASLRDLAGSGWGRVVVLAVGAGLAAFGCFSIAEARDRRVLQST